MSTWKAVHVTADTPTELEGWYVIGDADSGSPVVLKVEGSDIGDEREVTARRVAAELNAPVACVPCRGLAVASQP